MNCAKPSAAPLNEAATVNTVTSFHLDPPRAIFPASAAPQCKATAVRSIVGGNDHSG
jgi:hypothetical protein